MHLACGFRRIWPLPFRKIVIRRIADPISMTTSATTMTTDLRLLRAAGISSRTTFCSCTVSKNPRDCASRERPG